MGVRILGIDPGSRFMGYGLIEKEGNRFKYLEAGRLCLGDGDFGGRLVKIDSFLSSFIVSKSPQFASMETMFYAKNAASAIKLSHARGVALCACCRSGLDVFEYAPTDVKQSVVGHGRAEKSQVAEMVKVILGVREEWESDASDALAIAICHGLRMKSLRVF